jgi:hypothetical protein
MSPAKMEAHHSKIAFDLSLEFSHEWMTTNHTRVPGTVTG